MKRFYADDLVNEYKAFNMQLFLMIAGVELQNQLILTAALQMPPLKGVFI
ncbi:MAG: hypothetical protein HXX09_10850 [Bacteroidetes bacterium]|nr:hypothetical protein [Bacteroidota bacterium]